MKRRAAAAARAVSFDRALAAAVAALLGLGSTGCAGAGDGGRDVVPESRDVIAKGGAPAAGDQGYEYVARRPLAVVALAEARGIDPGVARAAIERLADRLDACVTDEGRKGNPVAGAARVIAQVAPTGDVAATSVRVDPGAGSGAASSAVVCLVAPVKLLAFPPAEGGGQRGIAIEAIWGQVTAR